MQVSGGKPPTFLFVFNFKIAKNITPIGLTLDVQQYDGDAVFFSNILRADLLVRRCVIIGHAGDPQPQCSQLKLWCRVASC